jgi:hypothetical protein
MTTISPCPSALDLRRTVERHLLNLYEVDGVTLKPQASWPGYYTLPNQTCIPAVFVTGKDMVPSSWKVGGIECTINDVPDDIADLGTMSGLVQLERWLVRFTNYGTKDGTVMPISVLDIRRRLARTFPRDQVMYLPRTEATYEALTARISGAVLNPPIP